MRDGIARSIEFARKGTPSAASIRRRSWNGPTRGERGRIRIPRGGHGGRSFHRRTRRTEAGSVIQRAARLGSGRRGGAGRAPEGEFPRPGIAQSPTATGPGRHRVGPGSLRAPHAGAANPEGVVSGPQNGCAHELQRTSRGPRDTAESPFVRERPGPHRAPDRPSSGRRRRLGHPRTRRADPRGTAKIRLRRPDPDVRPGLHGPRSATSRPRIEACGLLTSSHSPPTPTPRSSPAPPARWSPRSPRTRPARRSSRSGTGG